MSGENRRQKAIVEGFQARFVVVQLIWLIGGLSVFAAVVGGPLVYMMKTAGPRASAAFADQFPLFHFIVWPVLIGLTAVLAAVFVRMSHRVAGSLYGFRRAFGAVAAGRLDTAVTLRPGDYLMQEQAEFNAMMAAVRTRVHNSQKAVAELDAFLADRTASAQPLTKDDVNGLRGRVNGVSSTLSEFVVGSGN